MSSDRFMDELGKYFDQIESELDELRAEVRALKSANDKSDPLEERMVDLINARAAQLEDA